MLFHSSTSIFNLSSEKLGPSLCQTYSTKVWFKRGESSKLSLSVSELQDITPEICYLTVDDATGKNKIVLNPIQLETIGGYIISKEVLTGVYQDIATLDANT